MSGHGEELEAKMERNQSISVVEMRIVETEDTEVMEVEKSRCKLGMSDW